MLFAEDGETILKDSSFTYLIVTITVTETLLVHSQRKSLLKYYQSYKVLFFSTKYSRTELNLDENTSNIPK